MTQHSPVPVRVALVEDKLQFRRGLQAILELTPDIECCGIYAAAEEALRQIPTAVPDVILMDINLPGVSGIECTRELKRRGLKSEIVMLTIEEDGERVFAALRAGAAGYLVKTATPGEIVDAIHLVARGGSPMSSTIARRVVESFHNTPEPFGSKEKLSRRETEVLDLIAHGKRTKEVATDLAISVSTVQTYLRRIYEKLQVNSQAEAIAKTMR
jgi:DNA-binding NarL/FixJ family response regulator